MRELVNKLNYYTKLYDEGHPAITDTQWDMLYFQLVQKEKEAGYALPDSPTQRINYEIVNSLQKVEHNHKMLSLDKTKSIEEVSAFLGNNEWIAMAKMDGLTCSLTYENGKLVLAETRGNGIIGEDITHNAKTLLSIPKKIAYLERLVVDGEIVCLDKDFEAFKDEYKNSRNFASGSIRLLDSNECAKRKLTFIAWEVIEGLNEYSYLSEKLNKLNDFGFTVVPFFKENIITAINDIKDYCKNNGYPIDGIVFKFNNIVFGKAQGETSHHAKNAIAFKFADEEYETFLTNIEWGMGRTGLIPPIAVFEPVDDGDSITTRANLHNLNIMKEILGKPYPGQKVWMVKQNMIIPQLVRAEKLENPNFTFPIPKVCPVCGKPTAINEAEQLYCPNPECSGKLINHLEYFFGKKGLDVKGLSKATFEKLIDLNWVTDIIDVYNLDQYKEIWMEQPGFGKVSVNKILDAIENSKNCSLDKFICAIGIPQIGPNTSKVLADKFLCWENFRQAVNDKFSFATLYDFGYITEYYILNFDYTKADELAKILNITYETPKVNSEKLNNKKIAITGTLQLYKNRTELEAAIAAAGGKSVSSVSKYTDILINNNPNSTSSKNLTAKKLGIPILTESEFKAEYLD